MCFFGIENVEDNIMTMEATTITTTSFSLNDISVIYHNLGVLNNNSINVRGYYARFRCQSSTEI